MKVSFSNPPEFLTLPLFGLDISRSAIRLTKLKRTSDGLVPEHVASVPISETCSLLTDEGVNADCTEVQDALRELKKKHRIEFVRVSIPEQKTYVFKVDVPNDAIHTVEEFILYNMDQYVPLNPQEVLFDYKILHARKGPGTTPVVVTAILQSVVEQYTAIIEAAGITVLACEPETHAIARAVIHRDDANPYIIINVGTRATNISVVEDGLVQYTQTLPVAGKDIAESVSGEVAAALKDSINRVIVYWFTSKDRESQGARIENIILTGTGAGSPNLINFLESSLAVNASQGNIWKNCFDLNDHIPTLSKQESLQYATCVGLCLAKLK